jgi:2-hydroxy-3-keto-5-methylthiopentenyl-1-phosphate phosphatase
VPGLLIACDFDGTVTERDTLHVIVEAFGTKGLWGTLQPRLTAGEITVEQAMQEEFAEVRAPWSEVLPLVLGSARVRRGFPEFVTWSRDAGHRLLIVSNGFRRVIDAVLSQAGVRNLEIVSHDAVFSTEGCRLVWSERGERCELCGRRCKRHDLRRRRVEGQRLVYLGDGISDRCAAQMADLVFARTGLAEYLGERRVPFVPFDDFVGIRRELEQPAIAAA